MKGKEWEIGKGKRREGKVKGEKGEKLRSRKRKGGREIDNEGKV